MKEIKLSQQGKNRGKFIALVDDEDFNCLNKYRWRVIKLRKYHYAIRSFELQGKRKDVLMHRVILNTPKELDVDHKDHNGLNNQRVNIRNCTKRQNNMNKTPYGKSKYLGVGFSSKQIQCHISINGKNVYLGSFKSEVDAAKKYDEQAKIHYGEFANLNFK